MQVLRIVCAFVRFNKEQQISDVELAGGGVLGGAQYLNFLFQSVCGLSLLVIIESIAKIDRVRQQIGSNRRGSCSLFTAKCKDYHFLSVCIHRTNNKIAKITTTATTKPLAINLALHLRIEEHELRSC